ncbi:Ser-Thr-rich glycosyl-phosphatidyl-inositol-anchored membrane family-domain-containing protein [Syncephalis fuscata]|nr:Ser-Thr-rich glycosyl-phosphatidyl-inositol-anchored membrane family-domain-containing protein [Syncephalis fuscata]
MKGMISTALTVALASAPVLANFYPTFPISNSVWPAGSEQTITWDDDKALPNINDISSFKLELQTGTDSKQKTLATIGTNLKGSDKSVKFTIPQSVGPSGKVYFLRFTPNNGDIVWTTRFTVTGGTGTFPSDVELPPGSSVSTSPSTGTSSPPTSTPTGTNSQSGSSSSSRSGSSSSDSSSTSVTVVTPTVTATPSESSTSSTTARPDSGNSNSAGMVSLESRQWCHRC